MNQESLDIKLEPLCPSSRPTPGKSLVFGVIGGTALKPQVMYLRQLQAITEELISKIHPISSAEIFRTASPCEAIHCQHFDGSNCRLATRIVEQLPTVTEKIPACAIRQSCRWWQQEGVSACLRCPQVVTDTYGPSDLMTQVLQSS